MAAKRVRKWREVLNLLGLFFTLIGGIALASAFDIQPTHFKMVEDPSFKPPGGGKAFAICHDGQMVVAGYGGPLVPYGPCPVQELKTTGPTPQLTAIHPRFVWGGLWLIIVGFLFQLPIAVAAVSKDKS